MAWLERFRGVCSPSSGGSVQLSGRVFHRHTALVAVVASTLAGSLIFAVGCGNQYRPVITPIQPTGPASLPSAYVSVISQPGTSTAGATGPCAGNTYSTPSIISLVDFSGDSIVAQADAGYGPLTFSLESGGANIYAPNCDGSLTTAVATTTSLQTKNVQTSTLGLGADSYATNTLLAGSNLYVTQTGPNELTCPATNCVAQFAGSPEGLKQEIPVAPSLINMTGYGTGERVYAISQGNSGTGSQPAWGDCANPSSVTADGEADAIESATNTVSARLPLGICPVYGFQTPDEQRVFIMNRGSGTVTVINSQLNAIDSNPKLGLNGTIAVGAGPVYADYYRPGQLLVTANYDANTISIIDVSLDVYNNDSATFGTVLATVPVGVHPVEVSILQDGSRVYVANQGDSAAGVNGSVSIVNLNTYTVQETISLSSHPHAIASIYNYPIGKVYVASQDSPYLTVIRTDTDIVSATPEMQGNIVEMRVSAQYPGQATTGASNYQTESRSVGSGAP